MKIVLAKLHWSLGHQLIQVSRHAFLGQNFPAGAKVVVDIEIFAAEVVMRHVSLLRFVLNSQVRLKQQGSGRRAMKAWIVVFVSLHCRFLRDEPAEDHLEWSFASFQLTDVIAACYALVEKGVMSGEVGAAVIALAECLGCRFLDAVPLEHQYLNGETGQYCQVVRNLAGRRVTPFSIRTRSSNEFLYRSIRHSSAALRWLCCSVRNVSSFSLIVASSCLIYSVLRSRKAAWACLFRCLRSSEVA